MRVVLDTNILVSRLLLPHSIPGRVARLAAEQHRVLASDATLLELAEVLAREKFDAYLSIADRQGFVARFARIAELVTINRVVAACRDPKDDRILEVAVNGGAALIVTGDKDLLALGRFESTRIVDPAGCWREWGQA